MICPTCGIFIVAGKLHLCQRDPQYNSQQHPGMKSQDCHAWFCERCGIGFTERSAKHDCIVNEDMLSNQKHPAAGEHAPMLDVLLQRFESNGNNDTLVALLREIISRVR